MFYPNVLLHDLQNKELYSPYDEKIMSLNRDSFYDNNIFYFDKNDYTSKTSTNTISLPVYFFIYNFDNYYHFLYDTLPYLYMYLELKKNEDNLKLLIQYPNPTKREFYKFNLDILNKIVNSDDIIIHHSNNVYKNIIVANSLTHGGLSNLPPRKEIYEIYEKIKMNIILNPSYKKYEYIYISRRTWVSKDTSNIGTNYTTRRKMMNEDTLVEELEKIGVREIFAENLTTDEKIQIFGNAKLIIGSIGGGMSNLLFSSSSTRSIVLVTPFFLDINYRFKYSMENTDIHYFNDVCSYKEKNEIPLYCRVKIKKDCFKDKIGEIVDYSSDKNKYNINISNNDVAGFNNEISFQQHEFSNEEFELLDNGLNSPYTIDVSKLILHVKNTISSKYEIYNETKNIYYDSLSINDIFDIIEKNSTDKYYKYINKEKIEINNEFVLKTHFICHRINTIEDLQDVPDRFGVELDIRDDCESNKIILSHDPFQKGVFFEEYLKKYKNNTLILNIKSERTEIPCIKHLKDYNISNYFFLDSNLPMTYLLNKKYENNLIACRFSEFEPIENYYKIKNMITWLWVDCFTKLPINNEVYSIFKNDGKKICIVSPELQNQFEKITEYRKYIMNEDIIPDAICCKMKNIIKWI